MVNVFIPILLAVVIGVVDFLSKRFHVKNKKYLHKVLSFSAGVSITYLLLELLPLFTEAAFKINKLLFVTLLFGFISHHLAEKQIYQHNVKHDLVKMLTLEEHVFYFVYHIILGTVLVTFTQNSVVQGLLLFFSIITFTAVSNLPSLIHKSIKKAIFLSSSTLIGVLIAISLWGFIPEWIEFSLVGFAAGVLLFTVKLRLNTK